MKKVIQVLIIIVLLLLAGLIVIAIFNPFNIRNQIIADSINYYLQSKFESSEMVSDDKENSVNIDHPLLNAEQEKMITDFGIDVSAIPTSIDSQTQECLINQIGEQRAMEILNGSAPTGLEIIKAQGCL